MGEDSPMIRIILIVALASVFLLGGWALFTIASLLREYDEDLWDED